MRRHEDKCGFRPRVWNEVPEKELPGGVRVNLFDFRNGLIDIRPFQFGEEVENLPAKWRAAFEDRKLQQQAIAGPSPEVANAGIPVALATHSMLEQQATQPPVAYPMGFNTMVATDAALPQMGYNDMEADQAMWAEMGYNNMLPFEDRLAQMADNMMLPTEGILPQMADNNNTAPPEGIWVEMDNSPIGTPEEMYAQMGKNPMVFASDISAPGYYSMEAIDNDRAYQDPFSMVANGGFYPQPAFDTNENFWAQ
jgi:hypothetical protein